jgi:hypothetical protein
MNYVTRAELIEKIKATNGAIFSVLFLKSRSNNEPRRMNCMLNVKKHLTGTGKAAPESAKVITVYDLVNKGYRSIAHEGLIQAQIGKEVYEVRELVEK